MRRRRGQWQQQQWLDRKHGDQHRNWFGNQHRDRNEYRNKHGHKYRDQYGNQFWRKPSSISAHLPNTLMSPSTLRLLLSLLGVAFVGLTAWSLRYFSRSQTLSALGQDYAQPGLGQIGLKAGDVLVVAHEQGRRRWRVSAQTLTLSRDRRSVGVDGIKQGTLYGADGKPEISLDAGHARYATPFGQIGAGAMGTLRVDGGVRAILLSAQRPVLTSGALVWDAARSELSSPGPVTATLPKLSVTAGNGTYDKPPGPASQASRGTLRLGGNVRALLRSPRGPVTLDCPGLTWDAAQDKVQSLGPVTALIPGDRGTATVTAAEANTKTGDLILHNFRGTLRLPHGVE